MPRRLTFDRDRCLACRSCELACAVVHSSSGGLVEAITEDPPPQRRVTIAAGPRGVAALRCSQCDEPVCVFSCKSGALFRLADGGVEFDESRCVDCLMCLMVCPFVTSRNQRSGAADSSHPVRCDVCARRDTPACVVACPTKALAVAAAAVAAGVSTAAPAPHFTGHLVVVGSSAAGIAACEAARELAPDCRITMITADEQHHLRPLLPYVLAERVGRGALTLRTHQHLESLRVDVIDQTRATRLAAGDRRVWIDEGRAIAFDALVIATGARATTLRVPGCDLVGVYQLRDQPDLDAIELRLREASSTTPAPGSPQRQLRAVVVGGGNVGVQACEALVRRGAAVTLVVRSPHVLSQMLDEEAGRRADALVVRHDISLRTGRDVVEIAGDGRVERVRLDDGEWIGAELVVVGKGIQPNVEWLQSSGVRVGRGIVVDRSGRTSLPGVFAAGDCAEVDDPLTGQCAVSGIWPIAYEMGRAAGSAAVGADRQSPGALRMNSSRLFDTPVIAIGEVRAERVARASEHVVAVSDEVYRKLVMRDDRLIGALLVGDVSGAGLFYRLYRDGLELGGMQAQDLERRRSEWTAGLATP
jgi:nitrite reductase (NADH) large subunit